MKPTTLLLNALCRLERISARRRRGRLDEISLIPLPEGFLWKQRQMAKDLIKPASSLKTSIVAFAMLLWLPVSGVQAAFMNQNGYLFDNTNIYSVQNQPTQKTVFTLTNSTTITEISTYHWNNGLGHKPGTIKLKGKKGLVFGPFPAQGTSGQGGAQSVNWIVNVSITLPPDTYTVIDSHPSSWSQNSQSLHQGFTRITAASSSASVGSNQPSCASSSPNPVPYGGNCHGAGCAHPDLISLGGNGPFGSAVTDKHIHNQIPQNAMVLTLDPTENIASLEQFCQTHKIGGSLELIDDEPWYYYFIGFYSRFACM